MNNKIIAAGVVVALCAVALIGVGYAYTATVTTENNVIGSEYVTIKSGSNVDTVWTFSGSNGFEFNTTTTNSGIRYSPQNTAVTGGQILVEKSPNNSITKVRIEVSIDLNQQTSGETPTAVLDEEQKKLFCVYSGSSITSKATISIKIGENDHTTSVSVDGNVVKWTSDEITLTEFGNSGENKATVSIIPNTDVTLSSANSISNLKVTFVATPVA